MTLASIISKYLDSNHSERVDLKWSLGKGKLFINLYDFSAIVVCFFPPLLIGNPNLIELRDVSLILTSGNSLEESMATHSIILAWKIPWTEESGGLQSMGSQRVRHN